MRGIGETLRFRDEHSARCWEQKHRLAQIQEYYRSEHEKEAGDRRRREELAKILKRINQGTCRLEREELTGT